MTAVTIEEAQSKLPELIHKLTPGEELLITEDNQPVARLIPANKQQQRKLGGLQGTVIYMAPDFDAPIEQVVITENKVPVAKLMPECQLGRKPRQPGNCKGMLTIISDDDEHLKDFADYMP